ncbi:alpha-hydroxy acid oxidase [Sphingobium subterraneum]|uniref:Isopentenyl diphosphate isomerase/L-lactate dehydrogenase-like FMN-dependent dehydrogenase n=1 Tax=Sphingobium subterraneum TaxID=627688 RepID=A0A841J1I3_9SPHN|nr:alpha-hydroxy acid oxidase [Sphingobium subterraneum]MBB6122398.1 isopentenyl diphosphate isomerase/L-lactate dehydrogenase-like FMN-dependent dehydrogenase [Sphingobium subterraneum]
MKPHLDSLPPDMISLDDYARLSRQFIEPATWEWLQGGSGQLQALKANETAFSRHAIYNRVLVDMKHGTTRSHLAGLDLAHPIALAPVGYHRLVHDQGEVATARGALDTLMVVSTMASVAIEEIAAAAAGPLWFQLYMQPHRDDTLHLLRRAETAGCQAIVVTLDTPVQPASHAAHKAGFVLPPHIDAVHLRENGPPPPVALSAHGRALFQAMMAQAPTRTDLEWLRDATALPLIAKGISHPGDAAELLAMGYDGIVVSNHGGRALDSAPAPLTMLPAVRSELGPDAVILFDGGVRTGSDVFKAIALGANAVLIGRPQLHALAVAGSLGVAHMLKLLREELELVMALAGTPTIADITRSTLVETDYPGGSSC